MRNKSGLLVLLAYSALMLASIACSLVQPSTYLTTPTKLPPVTIAVPTTVVVTHATAVPTSTVVQPAATATVESISNASLNGTWQGKTSEDTDFQFTVQDNQVTYFNLSYYVKVGTCSASGGLSESVSAPIVDNKFTVQWSDTSGQKVSFTGTITSPTQATGTLEFSKKSKICGDINSQMTWNVISDAGLAAGQVVTAPTSQPVAQAGYNGTWNGVNSDGNQVTFNVDNDKISFVMVNYSVSSNGCSLGGAVSNTPENAPINADGFSVQFKDSDGRQFTITGKFASKNMAEGKINVKGTADSFCGAFVSEMPWIAKSSASSVPTNPSPTDAPQVATPTLAPVGDPAVIVNGFFNAINTGNIDAALAFVDDNLIFTFGSANNSIGKDSLKAFLTNMKSSGTKFTLSNPDSFGESMFNFSAKSSDGTVYSNCLAMLSGGKIVILKLK